MRDTISTSHYPEYQSYKLWVMACGLFIFSFATNLPATQGQPPACSLESQLKDAPAGTIFYIPRQVAPKTLPEPISMHPEQQNENRVIAGVLAAGVSAEHALKYLETQFDTVKWIYTISTGLFAAFLGYAGWLGFKSIGDIRREMKEDFTQLEQKASADLAGLRGALEAQIAENKDRANKLEERTKTIDAELAHTKNKFQAEGNASIQVTNCFAKILLLDAITQLIKKLPVEEEAVSLLVEDIVKVPLRDTEDQINNILAGSEEFGRDRVLMGRLYSLRSNVEKRLEMYDKALASAQEALRYLPERPLILYNVACNACLCGLKPLALDYLGRVITELKERARELKERAKKDVDFQEMWADAEFIRLTT